MALNNITVSEVNFTEVVGEDLHQVTNATLTIRANEGYYILAPDFSLGQPLPEGIDIDNTTFTQVDDTIDVNIAFLPGTIMPSEDISFPLCLIGEALANVYSISGEVIFESMNSTPVSSVVEYSTSGEYQSSGIVFTTEVVADEGYYFFQEPTIGVSIGESLNYTITKEKNYNSDMELVSVTFSVSYTYPLGNISNDVILINSQAVPSIIETTYVSAFTLNGNSSIIQPEISVAGDVQELIFYGDPGANLTARLVDVEGGDTLLIDNEFLPASGSFNTLVQFPAGVEELSPFKIVVSGDINPDLANTPTGELEITIPQSAGVFLEVEAETTNADISLEGALSKLILVPNFTYDPEALPTMFFSIVATETNGNILEQIAEVTADSFTPSIPDPDLPGFLYSLSNLNTYFNSDKTTFTVQGNITVSATQAESVTHNLNLDNIISSVNYEELSLGSSNEDVGIACSANTFPISAYVAAFTVIEQDSNIYATAALDDNAPFVGDDNYYKIEGTDKVYLISSDGIVNGIAACNTPGPLFFWDASTGLNDPTDACNETTTPISFVSEDTLAVGVTVYQADDNDLPFDGDGKWYKVVDIAGTASIYLISNMGLIDQSSSCP